MGRYIIKKYETFPYSLVCSQDKVGEQRDWGVVFVDHDPVEARARSVDRLVRRASLVVMHDTEAPTKHMNFPEDFM